MPVLVTATQLRNVLGVSVSLYADAALDEYIESAEDAIGDFLIQHSVQILKQENKDNVRINYTDRKHKFYVGQTISVAGLGSKTVLEILDDYTFTHTQTESDFDERYLIPSVKASANSLVQYNGIPAIEKAVIALAVEIFQAILTTGGTAQALDFTPSPYRLGRTLLYKVTGLISKYMDERGMVG
jgi:hypothetical protein